MSLDREEFKNRLVARGVDWSDQQIDNFLTLQQSGENLGLEMQKRNPVGSAFQEQAPRSFEQTVAQRMGSAPKIPQEQKSMMYDFVGNLLWEALDTSTFGALGALDYEDVLEDAITGGEPESFAGRAGAGLGGFAGFLLPFAGTKKVITSAVQAGSKYGTKKLLQDLLKKHLLL